MNALDRRMAEIQSNMIDVCLVAMRYAAPEINLLEFEAVGGGILPAAEPGAHVELHLPGNMIRHYSLVIPDNQPSRYVLGVKRDASGRGGSIYIHDQLRVGQTLRISTPRNNFPLVNTAPHVVLIAGGIGITPLISMARRMDETMQPWSLYYAARSRKDAAFLRELEGKKNVTLHFDDENPSAFLDIKQIIRNAPAGSHFYCCGPAPMLQAFELLARTTLAPEQIHVEYFASVQEAAVDGGFVVELARSKREFTIPAGKSILEVLLDAGLNVAYSCTEGICGACEVRVLSGIPDHRDSVLTPDQQAQGKRMMICCSGSRTDRLVIDI